MFGLGWWDPDKSDRPAAKKAPLTRRLRRRARRLRLRRRRQQRQRQRKGDGGSPANPASASGFQRELLALHNQARPANYKLNATLCKTAQAKAEEMARTGRMSHTNADGSPFYKRLDRAGYDYRTCGENIGEDFATSKGVFVAWMNSPGHRANILAQKYTEIGFGHSGDYWCTHFGDR